MASPIIIGGVQVLAADQGDTFAWGGAIKAALAQVAASCLQTTGGSFPLAADLNLGQAFGLVVPYVKSSGATGGTPNGPIASGGVLRMLANETVNWRNTANNGDDLLAVGTGSFGPADALLWVKTPSFAFEQITGNPFLHVNTGTGLTIANGAGTTVLYDNVVTNTDAGSYNTGTGLYTVPANKAGIYLVMGNVNLVVPNGTGIETAASIFFNGTTLVQMGNNSYTVGAAQRAGGWVVGLVNAAAGNTIGIQMFQASGAGRALTGFPPENYMQIKRLV